MSKSVLQVQGQKMVLFEVSEEQRDTTLDVGKAIKARIKELDEERAKKSKD